MPTGGIDASMQRVGMNVSPLFFNLLCYIQNLELGFLALCCILRIADQGVGSLYILSISFSSCHLHHGITANAECIFI